MLGLGMFVQPLDRQLYLSFLPLDYRHQIKIGINVPKSASSHLSNVRSDQLLENIYGK